MVLETRRTSGLGVSSVWMNIVRRPRLGPLIGVLVRHCESCGLWWRGEDVMGDAVWWRVRVAVLEALDRSDGLARESRRRVDRDTEAEAIVRML